MTHRVFSTASAAAFAAVLLLALALSPRAAPAADGEAAALLAKHQAYVGWASGDGAVKTLRESGQLSGGTSEPAKIRLLRFGVAYRETSEDFRGLENDDGFTGNVFWSTSSNGFTVRPIGEVARFLVDDQALFGELTAAYSPALLRHEVVDGADTAVLRLTHNVGYPMDVYVDPATGAYRRAVIDPGGKYEEIVNGLRYTEVQGKRFISAWHYGTSKRIHEFDKIELNPEIAPDTLRPPAQTATWTFGTDSIPVELKEGTFPRIFIEATMNGVKGKFMLDTGAAGTVVVDSFARRAGAKRVGETRIGGIGGSAAANLFRIDQLGVGNSVLHNLIITSGLDERWFEREQIVGLIGFDLLGGAVVELNLDEKTLRVSDPATVAPDVTHGIVLHPDLTTHHMRVAMKINGKVDVIATLDSGNPINVLFSKDLINRDRLTFLVDPSAIGSVRYGGGVGSGYEIEHCGKLSSLTLGPIEYKPVPACDSEAFDRNEILVGLDFMKAFNYVFSYPDGIVVLTPRKNR
jgi:predicted aspartyl protease